uniref:BESS domain-containing protein n=1 Tax=Glossina morsitans morsitans TaxID=37546 RepID=A0A1B0G5J1_GLOMM
MKSVKNYARNKEDTLFTQCEFLLPFINSPNCASAHANGEDDDNDFEGIDLTHDILDANLGNSPVIGEDNQCIKFKVDNTHLNEVTSSAPDYQNDTQQTDENDSNVPEKRDFLISNQRSIKVTDENLYFRNKDNDGVEATNCDTQSQMLPRLSNVQKRQRLESQDDYYNQEADRMFLLSLVPDLNNVPSALKMAVKAEIAAAIARVLGSEAEVCS